MHALQAVCSTHPQLVSGHRIARFVVPDMRTRQGAERIAARVKRLDGIRSVSTNVTTHRVVVQFQPLLTGIAPMMAAIEDAGCSVADIIQSGATSQARDLQIVVPAMDCDFCADHVSRSLRRLPGVMVVTTDVADHRVTVRFAPEKVDAGMITAAVERAGYGIGGLRTPL
jgi:P-type Cu+ transporter